MPNYNSERNHDNVIARLPKQEHYPADRNPAQRLTGADSVFWLENQRSLSGRQPSSSITSMAAFGICFFSCLGGILVVLPAVTAYYFGAANFLGAYKLVSIFLLLSCLGFPVMGLSWEICASYALADIVFAASLLLAFVLTLFLREANAVEAHQSVTQ